MEKEKLGLFIAAQRKKRGLTQKQLAQALYVTDKAVSKWERGVSFPDLTVLEPLAEALGVSLETLISRGKATEAETESIVKDTLEISKDSIRKSKKASWLQGFALPLISFALALFLLFNGFAKSIETAEVYFYDARQILTSTQKGKSAASMLETTQSSEGVTTEIKASIRSLCGSEEIGTFEIAKAQELSVNAKHKKGKEKLLIVDEKNKLQFYDHLQSGENKIKLGIGKYHLFAVGYWYSGKLSFAVIKE